MLKKITDKLFCPLVSSLIQVFIILVLFMQFFETNNHYDISIGNANIKNKIRHRINQCGKNYWISWIVLDKSVSKKRYYFKDVIGCNEVRGKNNCAFSVKEVGLNPFYNDTYHRLDKNTYKFLTTMDTGMVAYFDDTNKLKNYSSITQALKSTNLEITSLGITVTKDIRKNIIYIFTMSKTKNSSEVCDKRAIVNILEDLSIYSKDIL